jgi:hypothetical protein
MLNHNFKTNCDLKARIRLEHGEYFLAQALPSLKRLQEKNHSKC